MASQHYALPLTMQQVQAIGAIGGGRGGALCLHLITCVRDRYPILTLASQLPITQHSCDPIRKTAAKRSPVTPGSSPAAAKSEGRKLQGRKSRGLSLVTSLWLTPGGIDRAEKRTEQKFPAGQGRKVWHRTGKLDLSPQGQSRDTITNSREFPPTPAKHP